MSGDWNRQPTWIKAYRWLAYKPIAALAAVVETVAWIAKGCPPFFGTRRATFKSIWFSNVKSIAEYRMGNSKTTQEFIDELHERGRFRVYSDEVVGQIKVVIHGERVFLEESPQLQQFGQTFGSIKHCSFSISADQAEYLSRELLKAAKTARREGRYFYNV